MPSPICDRMGFAIQSVQDSGVPILSLFQLCSPSAIVRAIVTIIIDSVNRMFGARSFAHILNECKKRMPTVTNYNTPSAISMKTGVSCCVTTRHHSCPRGVQRVSRLSVFPIGKRLFLQTPTTLRDILAQTRRRYNALITAIALTPPPPLTVFDVSQCYNRPTIKSLPSQILRCYATTSTIGGLSSKQASAGHITDSATSAHALPRSTFLSNTYKALSSPITKLLIGNIEFLRIRGSIGKLRISHKKETPLLWLGLERISSSI